MNFTEEFLKCCSTVINQLDMKQIDKVAELVRSVRDRGGRLFVIGSGGGAGHASHAVCDFRKLCNLEAYAPYDNVSELTARVNDEGWETTLSNWLKTSRISEKDGLFVFSVGGGSVVNEVSMNLVNAIKLAESVNATVVGIAGKDGGFLGEKAQAYIRVPNPQGEFVVSHPQLQMNQAKWESLSAK